MNVGFWVTLVRAGLLMALGLALIFNPDSARPFLVNSMGLFWLAAGLVSLRWGLADRGERGLPLIAGFVGVLMGVGVLTRSVTFNYGPDVVVVYTLATLALITGVLHVFRGFRTRELYNREWSVESLLLGVIEIVLAVLLFITPLERDGLFVILLSVWALMGGLFLISQALFIRRKARQQERSEETREQPGR